MSEEDYSRLKELFERLRSQRKEIVSTLKEIREQMMELIEDDARNMWLIDWIEEYIAFFEDEDFESFATIDERLLKLVREGAIIVKDGVNIA